MNISPSLKFLNLYVSKGPTQLKSKQIKYQNYPVFNKAFINRKGSMATVRASEQELTFPFCCCNNTVTKLTWVVIWSTDYSPPLKDLGTGTQAGREGGTMLANRLALHSC